MKKSFSLIVIIAMVLCLILGVALATEEVPVFTANFSPIDFYLKNYTFVFIGTFSDVAIYDLGKCWVGLLCPSWRLLPSSSASKLQ